ncbi:MULTISPECIES: SAVED domain-containing protein [unclassified Myxococcus]|uniref:SAVED domain-containing protein n=1 Tax=unclassified Myxococcus TaxID=2648731 RepID=UPI00157A3865|nr:MULTISPECIES: SAVED domain-containing protein [unclassified Myxococcus]NTX33991.1 SAVED domain-containing protein [Myxococcus sp. CA033]NTX54908.1 SAVED domain-containing protein [Myxococcus sp. CA039A]
MHLLSSTDPLSFSFLDMDKKPLSVSLEFKRTVKAFSRNRLEYEVRHTRGERSLASFPWDDPKIIKALDELEKSHPSSEVLELFGDRLFEFLEQTRWPRYEAAIEEAQREGRPIDLTIRTDAPELYYLPWELLKLSASGNQLAELPDCLVRCEWLPKPLSGTPPLNGRLLFACSAAGGGVPFQEHLEAIQDACQKGGLEFDPLRDVLRSANRGTLANALADTERPVTVLHLLCHGGLTRENAYGLLLSPEDPYEEPDRLDPTDLRRLLPGRVTSLRLVTLCACQSGDAGIPAHILGSVARVFHRVGVPAVIASRLPFSCKGSVTLVKQLYAELLFGSGNLRKALSSARRKLMLEPGARDWAALQFYGREEDEAGLRPFAPPELPSDSVPRSDLVLVCHQALSQVRKTPGHIDAPRLLENRRLEEVSVDQTQALGKNRRSNLSEQVRRLTKPGSELLRTFSRPGVELLYYGFPLVPFAVLAGYLARATQHVHVIEYDREKKRFTWDETPGGSYAPLEMEGPVQGTGSALQLRVSISSEVKAADCETVLPARDVRADLHFKVASPSFGIVQREEQAQAYRQTLRSKLNQCMAELGGIESIHVFAAIPVSIAFLLGQVLSATVFPRCYVYNFNAKAAPKPGYEWRLGLDDAVHNKKPFIHIFKTPHS